jgi:hypothetical protein
MKKLFSLLFAALILLSGMHLSFATHLCGGKVSAVKLSFVGEKATNCGMCGEELITSTQKNVSTKSCCKDEMSFYAVDNNYNPSTLQLNKPVNQLLQVFNIPENISLPFLNTQYSTNTNVQPPGKYSAYAVDRPLICIFRI